MLLFKFKKKRDTPENDKSFSHRRPGDYIWHSFGNKDKHPE